MKSLTTSIFALLLLLCHYSDAMAQKKTILIDVGHGQVFYSDPADGKSSDLVNTERLKYMTGELSKNAAASNAAIKYRKSAITLDALSDVDLLFIHVPSTQYTVEEARAIQQFIGKGGSLFIVSEVDYWATLDKTRVNEILKPFDIAFKGDSPDANATGGYSTAGKPTKQKYSIPYHGARLVEGGTPFTYSNATKDNPFGVYKQVQGGGKIVAMGEGMVSLYMTSWQDVTDYQCAAFMGETIGWLLE
jgi:hypothetical protein